MEPLNENITEAEKHFPKAFKGKCGTAILIPPKSYTAYRISQEKFIASKVVIKALPETRGCIYIGSSDVNPDNGFILMPNDTIELSKVDLSEIYYFSVAAVGGICLFWVK